ncbi:MAG: ABC transporter permease [Deltaproteobacteria bacterium]|nr:ABC transporter permease [Deltaproteobacteria bacterium]MBW2254780.1 ABC transporter permease [Deltaproteobacteria bacterium]
MTPRGASAPRRGGRRYSAAFTIRGTLSTPATILLGLVPVVGTLLLWWAITAGETVESRIISPVILPSPVEVAVSFKSLWFERALTWSVLYSTGRVLAGFGLAALIAVPLGILMGSFTSVRAMFNPVAVAGGYLPIAALVPLTLSWFGVDETQKVVFLAIGCFVFLLPLVVQAVDNVDDTYLKTAWTLGATRGQAVRKVLIPIAASSIYDAMRLVIGIGWTYIILAEIVAAERGLGNLIIISQRRGPREHIYLVLLVIVLLAFATDKLLELLGRWLFPHRRARR